MQTLEISSRRAYASFSLDHMEITPHTKGSTPRIHSTGVTYLIHAEFIPLGYKPQMVEVKLPSFVLPVSQT